MTTTQDKLKELIDFCRAEAGWHSKEALKPIPPIAANQRRYKADKLNETADVLEMVGRLAEVKSVAVPGGSPGGINNERNQNCS